MEKIRLDTPVKYRRFRGWDGRVYHIRLTEEEIRRIERLKLAVGIAVVVPLMIVLFAAAAGML